MNIPQIGELWQHYKTKGGYVIIGIGKLQVKNENLDMKECVIYKAISDEKVWVRPLVDFTEQVTHETGEQAGRFSKIK